MAQRYRKWYRDAEFYIERMLGLFNIFINTTYHNNDQHQHHEDVLIALNRADNPLFHLLGHGHVYAELRLFKNNHNTLKQVVTVKGTLEFEEVDWKIRAIAFRTVEAALRAALQFLIFETQRMEAFSITLQSLKSAKDEKQRHLLETMAWVRAQKAAAAEFEKTLQTKDEVLTEQRKHFEWEELRVIDDAANVRLATAELERMRKTHAEDVRKMQLDQSDHERRSAEINKQLKTKTQLTKDNQHLTAIVKDLKDSRQADIKKAKSDAKAKELAHRQEVEQLNATHAKDLQRLGKSNVLAQENQNTQQNRDEAHAAEMKLLQTAHQAQIMTLNTDHANQIQGLGNRKRIKEENKRIKEENKILMADNQYLTLALQKFHYCIRTSAHQNDHAVASLYPGVEKAQSSQMPGDTLTSFDGYGTPYLRAQTQVDQAFSQGIKNTNEGESMDQHRDSVVSGDSMQAQPEETTLDNSPDQLPEIKNDGLKYVLDLQTTDQVSEQQSSASFSAAESGATYLHIKTAEVEAIESGICDGGTDFMDYGTWIGWLF